MANAMYDFGRESFLGGDIAWDGDNIKLVFIDEADDTIDLAADQDLADRAAGSRVATSGNFASKTITAGVADAADVTVELKTPLGIEDVLTTFSELSHTETAVGELWERSLPATKYHVSAAATPVVSPVFSVVPFAEAPNMMVPDDVLFSRKLRWFPVVFHFAIIPSSADAVFVKLTQAISVQPRIDASTRVSPENLGSSAYDMYSVPPVIWKIVANPTVSICVPTLLRSSPFPDTSTKVEALLSTPPAQKPISPGIANPIAMTGCNGRLICASNLATFRSNCCIVRMSITAPPPPVPGYSPCHCRPLSPAPCE